jgi:hypothetical protein
MRSSSSSTHSVITLIEVGCAQDADNGRADRPLQEKSSADVFDHHDVVRMRTTPFLTIVAIRHLCETFSTLAPALLSSR